MESGRRLVSRDGPLLLPSVQSLRSLSFRPSIIRYAVSCQSRAFAKGKEHAHSKQRGMKDRNSRPTAPDYSHQKHTAAKESTVGSRQKFWDRGDFVIVVLFALVLAVGVTKSKRPRIDNPNPKPQSAREGVNQETLSQKHKSFTETWEASAEYRDLITFSEQTVPMNDSLRITTCMCLCPETLSRASWTTKHDATNYAMSQLVVFETMVKLLRKFFQCRQVDPPE